jgi:hypothetical protein
MGMAARDRTLLIDRPRLRAELVLAGSRPGRLVVVSFTERTHRQVEGAGFGQAMLLGAGVDVLAIKSAADTWYQNLRDGDLRRLAGAIAGWEERAGYGSSMGGYAAVRFAAALRLHRVLALSPVADILPDWEPRYLADRAQIKRPMLLGDHLSAAVRYLVAYDPQLAEDARQVAELQRLIPAGALHLVTIPRAGHPVGPWLRDAGVLKPFALAALTTGDVSAVRLPRRRERPAPALYAIAERCLARRPAVGLAVNARALALAPGWGELYVQRGKLLLRLGQDTDGLIAIRYAETLLPANPHVPAFLAQLLAARGARAEALAVLAAAQARLPDAAVLREEHVRLMSG